MNNKIRILIISQYFPPDISGSGTRAFNYAECLVRQNYDVTVISAYPHLHSKVPEKYRGKLVHREKMNGFDLIRVWIPSLFHTSARNRIILHLSFIISSLFPIFSIKPDIIFASSPNLFSFIPAYIYSKFRGGKVIRVVDDLWPEAFYEHNYVKSKLLKKILYSFTKFSYSYPKYIIPLTTEQKKHIHESYDIINDKIVVIEHGVDTDIYTYNERPREKFFVLMYSGSFAEQYDFDIIIEAAQKLQNKNFRFILRGTGTLLPYVVERKEILRLENLIIDTTLVPYEQISDILSRSDVLLVPLKKKYRDLNLALQTKLLEYQAVGRPIICCSDGAPGNYIERTKSGIRIECGNLNGFLDAILKLESDPTLCNTLGKNGREFVKENLTFEKIGKRLMKLIEDILP